MRRRKLHQRKVIVDGYLREDGLYEIEATLLDVKSYDMENRWRGAIAAGAPLHAMSLTLVLDDVMTVIDVKAATEASPYPQICPRITHAYTSLVGEQLGNGWSKAVKDKVGGVAGCTHLTELLLGPLSTTAYITIFLHQKRRREAQGRQAEERPRFIGTCHALKADGEVIRYDYPQYAD